MQSINIRKSNVELGKLYFWTATINNWYQLLREDALKEIIISSLKHLCVERKIEMYAFVLMPNHLHFIWQLLKVNGKEKPHTSFLKFTAHSFKKHLQITSPEALKLYAVDATNKEYEFWQRDSLAVPLYSRSVAFQKLKYIHTNPLAEHWQLVKYPCDYRYSSARYYELNEKNFSFLKDLWEVF